MANQMSLANQFLVAMPSLNDSLFSHSVIYLCEHHTQGTIGLIINRPLRYNLNIIFDQINVSAVNEQLGEQPLLFGGPIQAERGFVIHKNRAQWQSSLYLQHDVVITTSNDIIRAIAQNTGPSSVLILLGYVAWGVDQLDEEIMSNSWLVCPFSQELLYDVPYESRWAYAGTMLGVDMNQLTGEAGHA